MSPNEDVHYYIRWKASSNPFMLFQVFYGVSPAYNIEGCGFVFWGQIPEVCKYAQISLDDHTNKQNTQMECEINFPLIIKPLY
jgi:hypothetical protein